MLDLEPQAIPEVLVLRPKRIEDSRGFFVEHYSKAKAHDVGLTADFIQDNVSLSVRKGTVRGLHFQIPPAPQAKLVSVMQGAIIDVAVDIRKGSPTYGKYVAVEITASNGRQIFIPEGFAHGFVTLEANTMLFYKVSGLYSQAHDRGVRWNDPAIGFDWGGHADPGTLSEKDKGLPAFAELPAYWTYGA